MAETASRRVPDPIRTALSSGLRCLFLSPHLDDVVLSCGALLAALAARSEVTVATVFTDVGESPFTRVARSFVRGCNASDPPALYAERRAEDRAVLDALDVRCLHLGALDAPFRRRRAGSAVRRLARVVPELDHCYPTYHLDIARGRVTRGDRPAVSRLAGQIAGLLDRLEPDVVFGPLGVGRHVDHVIVRDIVARHAKAPIFYGDFPYLLSHPMEDGFVQRRGLREWVSDRSSDIKPAQIAGYRTQVLALFPDGTVPVVPEVYFTAHSDSGRAR